MSASFEAPAPAPIPTGGAIAITAPLSIGDLLDRTFRVLRARFGVLMFSAAIVLIPLGLIVTFLTGRYISSYAELFQFAVDDPASAQLASEQVLGSMLGAAGVIFIATMLNYIGFTLVSLMSMHHIQRFLLGETSTVGGGWRVAIRRLLPLIGMQILQFMAVGAVTVVVGIAMGIILFVIALVLGGTMAAIGNETASIIFGIGLVIVFVIGYLIMILLLLAPSAYLFGRWVAAGPSLLVEELGPMAALQRSWKLTKGRVWRAILYLALMVILVVIVLALPLAVLNWASVILFPSQALAIGILYSLATYLVNLLAQPFYATGTVLFYYDLRVRAEAYDVQLRVAALEAEVAPDAPPA